MQVVVKTSDLERAQKILTLLRKEHPDAKIALRYGTPLELLVATMLSAQATDRQINKVTEALFRKYRTAADYAEADLTELETDIKSTGFYHTKARNLKKAGQMLMETFDSEVPRTMKELVTLPGVARKTANIVLSKAFGVVDGIAVDTHVKRLAQRFGLTDNQNPEKIERDLMMCFPKDNWSELTDLLIFHGRRVCTARNPNCKDCVLRTLCPSAFTFGSRRKA